MKFNDVHPDDEKRVHEKLGAKMASLKDDKSSARVRGILDDAKTLYDLLRDKTFQMEWADKAKLIGALLYFIMPLDLIPDFIIGAGYVDDAVILAMTIKALSSIIERYRVHVATSRTISVPSKTTRTA